MAGTKAGGMKAAATNLAKDPLFYVKIGHIGGSKTHPGKGFAGMDKEKVREAGRKGGYRSRRTKKTP